MQVSSFQNFNSCPPLKGPYSQEWQEWWYDLWESDQENGSYADTFPFSSRYFQALMEAPFYEETADSYDQKIFDLFIAIEDEDAELLEKNIEEFAACNKENRLRVFTAAVYLAVDLKADEMAKLLRKRLKGAEIAFESIDKTKETGIQKPEIKLMPNSKGSPAEQEAKPSVLSTIAKVAMIGMLILGLGTAAYYLYSCYNQPTEVSFPYNAGTDLSGTPRPSCDRPDYWHIHQKLIRDTVESCSTGLKLSQKINEEAARLGAPNWSLQIRPSDYCPTSAQAEFKDNLVVICCNNTEPVASTLFELGNLRRGTQYSKIMQEVYEGRITNRDQFAFEFERVEFGTLQDHNDHLQQCIEEKGWKATREWYPRISWSDWWKRTSNSKHTEEYRKDFDLYLARRQSPPSEDGMITSVFNRIKSYF